jgi:methanogenic corrinoid protein MtbC1
LLEILVAAECSMGIEATLDEIVLPALVDMGNRWQRSTMSIGAEHLLSEVICSWLDDFSRTLPSTPANAPRVVVACIEDERHEIGARALALFLRREGLRVAYFGSDMPTDSLMEVVRSGSFAALCLVVTMSTSLPTTQIVLGRLIEMGSGTLMYVGGPAFSHARGGEADAIPGMRLSESIAVAAQQVARQLRAVSKD